MKRISTSTAIQNRFVDGNKSTGRKATQFSAEWCNQIQEELANLLELNGITLGASEHQIFDLFAKFFTRGFSSISFTVGDVTINIGSDGKVIVQRKNNNDVYAALGVDKIRVQTPGQGSEITPEGFSHSSVGGNSVNLDENGLRFGRVNDKTGVMNYDGSEDAMVFDKPVKVDEYLVGAIWKLRIQSTQSGSAFIISRRNGNDWNDELIFNSDGSVATFNSIVKSEVGFGLGENWRFIKGQGDSLVIQLYDGADWNDVAIFKNDGTLLTVKPELKVGNITVEKVKGDGNNLQVCGFSFSSPTGGAYKHEINGYDGTNIASRIYNMVLDTTARKIMKASQNNSIELLDGEVGLVKVPRGSGNVQITETNTQTTCTCVAESGSDRVYLVARVDNKIYVVM